MTTLMTTTRTALGGALLALALGLLLDAGDARAQAPPETELTLTAEKDSFLRRGNPDRNEGANPGLRLQAAGDNRVVVGFDPDAIDGFGRRDHRDPGPDHRRERRQLGPEQRPHGRCPPARGRLRRGQRPERRRAGLPVDPRQRPGRHLELRGRTPRSPTSRPTAIPRWNGGTFGPATAAPVLHFNGLTGEVSWDVTDDVLAGASAWLIKKTSERQAGRVTYHSKEGADPARAAPDPGEVGRGRAPGRADRLGSVCGSRRIGAARPAGRAPGARSPGSGCVA